MSWVDVALPLIAGFLMASGPELYIKAKPGDLPEKAERLRARCRWLGIAILLAGVIMVIAKLAAAPQGSV